MKHTKTVAIVLSLFILGFIREFIFENINTHLYYLWKDEHNPYLPEVLSFLKGFSYYPLYYSKFLLIVVFTILFLYGSILLIKQFFNDKRYPKITTGFFAGIFLLSALIFGIGYALGSGHDAYGISRKLIEFIQSPLAAFFLIPAFFLYEQEKN